MKILLAPASMGMGDVIVILPIIGSLIDQGHEVTLVLRRVDHVALSKRINGLSGYVLEWELSPELLQSADRFYDLRKHPLQTDYWWGSREFTAAFPGYHINNILSDICRDFGIDADLNRLRPLVFQRQAAFARMVAFVPGTAGASKYWPLSHWLQLHERLLEMHESVVLIGDPVQSPPVKQLVDAGLKWQPTADFADAIDILSSARAVISVDTGLMHVAVNQGIPTVGMFKQDSVYIRQHKHFCAIDTLKPCELICFDAERACVYDGDQAGPDYKPLDRPCVADEKCMDSISVSMVLNATLGLIKVAEAAKR